MKQQSRTIKAIKMTESYLPTICPLQFIIKLHCLQVHSLKIKHPRKYLEQFRSRLLFNVQLRDVIVITY